MAQPFVEPCSRGIIIGEPDAPEVARAITPRQRQMVLAACVLASSMAFIDGSALSVALPRLRTDLSADFSVVQWVINGYVLALASLTLVGGALADVYGKGRMLAVGCLCFGLASIACALAPTASWLIAARVVQGIAAAILTPASLALIGAVYPGDGRTKAIGVWAAASALATAGGPVLGGWLTDGFGWRYIFWINPPLALVAIGLIFAVAPSDRRDPHKFDLVGAVLLALSLGALAWALSQLGPMEARPEGDGLLRSWVVVFLVAGMSAIGLVAYARWERTTEHPMTPPHLISNRSFVGLNVATLMLYAGLSLMFFLMPFELVDQRALSSAAAGLALLPFTLGVGLLSGVFGSLADRVGPRRMLITGSAGAALAYLWMALARDASLLNAVIGPMSFLGVSFAILVAPLTAAVMSSVDSKDEALASGINNTASRIAQLLGVAFAAGLASFAVGYQVALITAAIASLGGALIVAMTVPPTIPGANHAPEPSGAGHSYSKNRFKPN